MASLYECPALLIPADEAAPGSIEPWEAVTAVRPDTPHHRALRVMDVLGELLAALVLVGGGTVLTGLSTLI